MRLAFITAFFSLVSFPLHSKCELIYNDHIYKKSIHTVLLHLKGLKLSNPVIRLDGENYLSLKFDDLTTQIKDYYYTAILCDANWEPSDIINLEYIKGFSESTIDHYKFSSNTNFPYIQYSLELPNRDMSFTKSGNYLLVVFENNNLDSIVLTKRFYVVDPMVNVEARIKRSGIVKYMHSHQEIQLEIEHKDLEINNAFREIKVAALQNFRWDNAYHAVEPVFVKDKRLIYTMDGKILFPGNKEFRHFDIRNLRLQNERVDSISINNDTVWLEAVEIRTFARYSFKKDINGKRLIERYETYDSSLDADYVYVNFTLQKNVPFTNGNIYVFGALSQWNVLDDFRMDYDYEAKVYEKPIFLKQGYYNYEYAFVQNGDDKIDTAFLEGNSQETENDYYIFVYYRPTGTRYDQLIAYNKLNSLE